MYFKFYLKYKLFLIIYVYIYFFNIVKIYKCLEYLRKNIRLYIYIYSIF